ncbi:TRAM domain-containing protein [Kushneria aurantia]|uniref:TRAM domain-containing protein n=1 Tax=Kushneria aurantia TaxID=504092 RepID=A0ABV6G6Z2_9GAMM|nr:TRAM domain-containing protein [Kushneria aurantia]
MAMLGQQRTPRRAQRKRRESATGDGNDGASVIIERLAHDGRGVARDADGKTLFVDRALPGERVEVAVHTQRGRFDEAHVRRVLTASPERVEPPCSHFGRCGGCDLQHLSSAGQQEHRRRVLREHFQRHAIELPEIALLCGEALGYRRRARLGVRVGRDGQRHLGYRLRGQDRLFDVTRCPILEPRLEALLSPLREVVDSLEAPRRLGHIELMAGDDAIMLTLRQLRQLRRVSGDIALWQAFAAERGVLLTFDFGADGSESRDAPKDEERRDADAEHNSERAPRRLERLDGEPQRCLTYRPLDDGPPVEVESGDFLQANAAVNRQLVAQVLAHATPAEGTTIVDLFAGVGNFSLPLAAAGAEVIAYEGRETMVRRLQHNARRAGQGERLTAHCVDLASAPQWPSHCAVALLDPPRGGAMALCEALAERGPARILYVSCEPATLARDIDLLVRGGYRISEALVADMFPQTAHLEALLVLDRYRV